MTLLDSIVDANFRSDNAERVVVFPGGRERGRVVKSEDEELRIKSFLKMFYLAHFSILLLGSSLAFEWSRELIHALDRRSLLLRVGVVLGIYSFIVGVPYWLLWRSYKKALLSFVSPQDQLVISSNSAYWRSWIVGAGLIALAILLVLGIASLLTLRTPVAN
jgi:hypothetical protein